MPGLGQVQGAEGKEAGDSKAAQVFGVGFLADGGENRKSSSSQVNGRGSTDAGRAAGNEDASNALIERFHG
jgi:hypothetical protein